MIQVYDGDGVAPVVEYAAPWAPAVVAREELAARGFVDSVEKLDRWNRLLKVEAKELWNTLVTVAGSMRMAGEEGERAGRVATMAGIVRETHL